MVRVHISVHVKLTLVMDVQLYRQRGHREGLPTNGVAGDPSQGGDTPVLTLVRSRHLGMGGQNKIDLVIAVNI